MIPDYTLFEDDPSYTPETYAVNCLEAISRDIMENQPDMLFSAVHNLLSNTEQMTYDNFSQFANSLSKNTDNTKQNIWSRIGMVLSVVKEAMLFGDLTDSEVEIIVDHSTKFVMENTMTEKILLVRICVSIQMYIIWLSFRTFRVRNHPPFI